MPRYFFSFDDGRAGTSDLVGRDLLNDEAAKAEAVRLAAEVALDRAIEGQGPPYEWIDVRDEAQRAVVRLPVAECAREPNRSS